MSRKIKVLENKALPVLTLKGNVKELDQLGRSIWSYICEYIVIYRLEQNSGNFAKLTRLNSVNWF